MVKADLHTHTTVSDGKYSPMELVDLAIQRSITTLAITDHDSCEGYFEAKKYAQQKGGINIIAGVEISTNYHGKETHMLAYLFDAKNSELLELLRLQKSARTRRAAEIIEKLNAEGLEITLQEVTDYAGNGLIGRPHFAKILQKKGLVSSHNEAFIKYLGVGGSAFSTLENCDIEDAIKTVHSAGGVAILAHPGKHTSDDKLEELREMGLDGVEYIHPSHDFTLQKKYQHWAKTNNLICTGGSDFHGFTNRDNQYFGLVCVDASIVANLRQKAHSLN